VTDDGYKTQGQYRAAGQSIKDVVDNVRANSNLEREQVYATLAVALSNLAVTEAIHRVAACLEKGTPVMIESRGTVELDPTAVAESIQKILDHHWRQP